MEISPLCQRFGEAVPRIPANPNVRISASAMIIALARVEVIFTSGHNTIAAVVTQKFPVKV
jgi:hypothetical protein